MVQKSGEFSHCLDVFETRRKYIMGFQLPTSTGDRRISEPSTVPIIQEFPMKPPFFPHFVPFLQVP